MTKRKKDPNIFRVFLNKEQLLRDRHGWWLVECHDVLRGGRQPKQLPFLIFFIKSDNILYYTIIKLLSRIDILDTILKA